MGATSTGATARMLLRLAGAGALLILLALGAALAARAANAPPDRTTASAAIHEGVASCGGSTCHGRPVGAGLVVRQNELVSWQDRSSAAGAHSRAWRVLTEPRAQAIADRLGLGRAERATECLGCHADPAPARLRGSRFQISDGVGCEACHGGAGGWLATHDDVVTHAQNVARGMTPLDDPKARAKVCLDCHYGGSAPGQFVSHKMMAAGHPRIAFELDLFSSLQGHYDLDADYAQRKQIPTGVQTWAVGQAAAVERALTLYADPGKGEAGAFPEFYFFDCHSCHRPISDDPKAALTAAPNPGRPPAPGTPPFNDENMIMLEAAGRTAAPQAAVRFEADSRAFHAALTQDRASAIRAAQALAGSARTLQTAFAGRAFGRTETFAILEDVLSGARYTDYAGGAQAVMAADTLLNALVASRAVDRGRAAAIRPDLDRAYAAVRDPNAYRPLEFRQALQRVATNVQRLR